MHQLILDLSQDVAQKPIVEKGPKLPDPQADLFFSSSDEDVNPNLGIILEASLGNIK
jgi:hypothetical protein